MSSIPNAIQSSKPSSSVLGAHQMPVPNPTLPNFFIVGAPKTGTTSLYKYLCQHPQIYMSSIKEPCYFASDVRMERLGDALQATAKQRSEGLRAYLSGPMSGPAPTGIITEWTDYLKLFQNAGALKARGEASVCYLWSAAAAANISAKVPDAKIIMILRDPANRAYSEYLMGVTEGLVSASFRTQIARAIASTDTTIGPLYPFLEHGRYYDQVKRYFDLFPRENIHILWYEQDWRQPRLLLGNIFRFLGIDSRFEVDLTRRLREGRVPRSIANYSLLKRSGIGHQIKRAIPQPVWRRLKNLLFKQAPSAAAMDPRDRSRLQDYYRDDIGRLSLLVDRDLSSWLAQ
jgi:hypothetical protein